MEPRHSPLTALGQRSNDIIRCFSFGGADGCVATKLIQPGPGTALMDDLLLPLFPLQVVLLPQELLPLHIFEDRYKEMIGECLAAKNSGAGNQEFGVLQAQGEEARMVGSTAKIVNVTRRYADGRMDILMIGSRRIEVLYTNEERSYLRGGVEFFDDDAGCDTPAEDDSRRAIDLFRETIQVIRGSREIPVHVPPPFRHLSFRIAGSLPLSLDLKQELLALRNESSRLEQVVGAMNEIIEHTGRVESARRKAGGNGHTVN